MPYNEELAARVREIVTESTEPDEKKMFGGIAFMVHGHMCCGVIKDDLVLRMGGEEGEAALQSPHARPMDFTGKPMKNFLYVEPAGTTTERDLRSWIGRALEFVATLPPKPAKSQKG